MLMHYIMARRSASAIAGHGSSRTTGVTMLRALTLAAGAAGVAYAQEYQWQTRFFTQYVDHFNYRGKTSGATFQQKYLINDTWWKPPYGPIFFYTGNEGTIELFAANSGLVWDLAPQFGALVVFGEHRYYGNGTSMPFGDASYATVDNLAYLSSEQALADYAQLLDSLKANLSAPDAPVVSFGGSYGGMLSSWFRIKYPASTIGALACSAPIRQFTGMAPPTAWNQVVTNTWRTANPIAPLAIWNAFTAMQTMATRQLGRDQIRATLNICNELNTAEAVTNGVFAFIMNAFGDMTMADYPYPTSFLGSMPAWPVNVSASYFTNPNATAEDLLTAMQQGLLTIYYNYTGQAGPCFNLSDQGAPGLGDDGWAWQSCTEMVR